MLPQARGGMTSRQPLAAAVLRRSRRVARVPSGLGVASSGVASGGSAARAAPGPRAPAVEPPRGARGRLSPSPVLSTSGRASCGHRSGRPPARPRRPRRGCCRPPPRRRQSCCRSLAPAAHAEQDFGHLALSLQDPRSWDAAAEQVRVAGRGVSARERWAQAAGPARAPRVGGKSRPGRSPPGSGSARGHQPARGSHHGPTGLLQVVFDVPHGAASSLPSVSHLAAFGSSPLNPLTCRILVRVTVVRLPESPAPSAPSAF